MAGFNFADRYKAAGLAPGPDIIRLRQEPFEKLRRTMSPERSLSLVRFFFELPEPTPGTAPWFREAFAEADPSFTRLDNAREFAVLSSCLLSAAFQERDKGHLEAGLAVLTTAAQHRQPSVMPTLIQDASHHLDALSVEVRTPPQPPQVAVTAASKVAEEADQLLQAPDWPQAVALFKKISEESQTGLNTLVRQTSTILEPLVRQLNLLQEEVNMLWWYLGGWSNVLDRPFLKLAPPVAAVMAGIDLARMVRHAPGPVAARAILHKLLWTGRRGKPTPIMLKDAIEAVPDDALQQLEFSNILHDIPDICPVLTALRRAAEIGKGTAWYQVFRKETGLTEDILFTPLDLSMQVYREAMLVSCLD